MKPRTLESMGWSPLFAEQVRPDEAHLLPGRAAFEAHGIYHVQTPQGQLTCELKGILRKGGRERAAYPVVGDWLLVEAPNTAPGQSLEGGRGLIARVLDRRNAIIRREQSRREAERRASQTQVLAANVEWGLITTSLNEEFNPRRLERYLGVVRDSGAKPAILLTKTDLTDDGGKEALALAKEVASDAPIILLSMHKNKGLKALKLLLKGHDTAVLMGSSGVGKSTLVNALLGEDIMATGEIREKDGRGRHTTVGRHLLLLPGGGCLIDSPGLRDLGLVDEGAVNASYDDIVALAATCRFSDCRHQNEPGCAVRTAREAGTLDEGRWEAYVKLRAETLAATKRLELGTERFQREKGKVIQRDLKALYRNRPGGKR